MPTKVILAPGYEVIAKASFDDVVAMMRDPARGSHVPIESTQGGRVLINPGHVTLISEEPDAVSGGPFGLGTLPAQSDSPVSR
jgi:hypothetical protein